MAGYNRKIKIGMDVAASEFFMKDASNDLDFKKQPNDGAYVHTAHKLCELYKEFVRDFPIVSIEHPFDQDDWNSWVSLQSSVDIQLVGDDLLVTNPKRIAEAIKKKVCNGLLLKVLSQVGYASLVWVSTLPLQILSFFMTVIGIHTHICKHKIMLWVSTLRIRKMEQLLVVSRNLKFFTNGHRYSIQILPAAVVAPMQSLPSQLSSTD